MQITFKECHLSFSSESFFLASKNIHIKIYIIIILFLCVCECVGLSYLTKGSTQADGVSEQCAEDDGWI